MVNYEREMKGLKALVSLTEQEEAAVAEAGEVYDELDIVDSIRTYKSMVEKWLKDDIKSVELLKTVDCSIESIETLKAVTVEIANFTELFNALDSVMKKVDRISKIAIAEAESEITRIEEAL